MRWAVIAGAASCLLIFVVVFSRASKIQEPAPSGSNAIGASVAPLEGRSTSSHFQALSLDSTQVTLPASDRGPEMSGTLTFPVEGCPCPATILIQGVGSHDRDYTLFGHKPFAVLAERLATAGIAALRFDERGVGSSGGTPGAAAPPEMARDILGWVRLLQTDPRVDPKRIGLLGHSEGGIVASLAATQGPDLAFVILLGTPGLPGLEYNLQYEASMGRSTGLDDGSIQAKAKFQARVLGIIKNGKDPASTEGCLRSLYDSLTPTPSPERIMRTIQHLMSPEFTFNLLYDPAEVIPRIEAPVLAVFGEKDRQVPPDGNAEAMEALLNVGSGLDRVLVLPHLNHLMQTSETGSPEEYPQITEPIASEAVGLILRWVRTHTGPRQVGSCTVMLATDGQRVLGAANEDWKDPLTRFWIIPGQNQKHGWIKFGFAGGFPQAGMNDQGLFWDATGSPYLEMPHSEAHKTHFDGPLMVKVMEEASTVAEAREIFEAWYCEDQYRAQYLLGDAQGASMIVEGDSILPGTQSLQVLTNFYQSRPDLGGYPCHRYETAVAMLADAESVTPFLMGQVLDATHQGGGYPTQYSVIYDLPGRKVHLFHYHNFFEYLTLDLELEMAKGESSHDIPAIFSQIRLESPAYQSIVQGSEVNLTWAGRLASQYRLCFSTSPELDGPCSSVEPFLAFRSTAPLPLLGTVSLVFFLAAFPIRLRNRRWGTALLLGAVFAANACVSDSTAPVEVVDPEAVGEMSYLVRNLKPGHTYFWKLKADSPGGSSYTTETVTFSFTVEG